MDIAVNLWDTYKESFDTKDPEIIDSIINSFEKSPFLLELKFYMLSSFLDNFEYEQIDRLLDALE